VMLRIQNDHTKERVEKRVTAARTRRLLEAENVAANVPKGIQIAPEVHCWNRFYRDYIVNSDVALFEVLPEFYDNSQMSCFQEALSAVTLASSAQQLGQPALMRRARRHYGRAMAAISPVLGHHSLCAEDSVLLTLFLFTLFEVSHVYRAQSFAVFSAGGKSAEERKQTEFLAY
jgi:hypothetical protein